MDESTSQGEAFEHYRLLLFSIAYRMTGSASDAEDLVQETYLRYQASASQEIVSLKAYLSTIITRLALDYLKSARVVREEYIGVGCPNLSSHRRTAGSLSQTLSNKKRFRWPFYAC